MGKCAEVKLFYLAAAVALIVYTVGARLNSVADFDNSSALTLAPTGRTERSLDAPESGLSSGLHISAVRHSCELLAHYF